MLHYVAGRKKQVEFQISFFGKLILKIYQTYLWNFRYHFFRKPQFEDLTQLTCVISDIIFWKASVWRSTQLTCENAILWSRWSPYYYQRGSLNISKLQTSNLGWYWNITVVWLNFDNKNTLRNSWCPLNKVFLIIKLITKKSENHPTKNNFCRFCVVIPFFHPRHNGQWPLTLKDFLSQILSIIFWPPELKASILPLGYCGGGKITNNVIGLNNTTFKS